MEPKVTFAPGLASDVVKPSRPSRKIPTEKDYGPLAYAIILPRRVMLPRLAATDPDIIENVDLAKLRKQRNAIEISLENMCDEARKSWPNTFGCLVDPTFEDGSCYALGFADNTRPENDCKIASFDFDLQRGSTVNLSFFVALQTDVPSLSYRLQQVGSSDGLYTSVMDNKGCLVTIDWKSDPTRRILPWVISHDGAHQLVSIIRITTYYNNEFMWESRFLKRGDIDDRSIASRLPFETNYSYDGGVFPCLARPSAERNTEIGISAVSPNNGVVSVEHENTSILFVFFVSGWCGFPPIPEIMVVIHGGSPGLAANAAT
ncbi:hypothetical protein GG344DRAFT_68787 [Lentinula edodes]|nr:hypothetical protein GG344DRAFT_68787 [Lentinula edodes]